MIRLLLTILIIFPSNIKYHNVGPTFLDFLDDTQNIYILQQNTIDIWCIHLGEVQLSRGGVRWTKRKITIYFSILIRGLVHTAVLLAPEAEFLVILYKVWS